MLAMLSYEGTCCIAVNYDSEAVSDPSAFSECLREGFAEVIAVG
jgi:hypothetical protein